MSGKHRRYFLKARESKELLDKASKRLRIDLQQIFKEKANVEVVQTESIEIFLMNGKPILAKTGENIYPTLTFKEFLDQAPKITVDLGAIPYICKGANVMAPGIRRFNGEFQKGDLVLITDEKHGKPIALGETLYDTEQAKNTKQGVIIKNMHYVGDKTWNQLKQITTPTKQPADNEHKQPTQQTKPLSLQKNHGLSTQHKNANSNMSNSTPKTFDTQKPGRIE